jgi:hypothetical protein
VGAWDIAVQRCKPGKDATMVKKKRIHRPPQSVYQIKVTLEDSQPPIWRRLLVPGEVNLATLHWIIQTAMGWDNSHLHQFIIRTGHHEDFYADPEFELEDAEDEGSVRLEELFPRAPTRFFYQYDFGDGWDHLLQIEKVLPASEGQSYPCCVAGALACPPEDSGGIYGYYEKLSILDKPRHKEHVEIREWMGEEFYPEAFDLAEVNRALGKIRW